MSVVDYSAENIPLIAYNSKNQQEKVIGIVHWVSDSCFNATLFDVSYTDIFYKEYDAETKELRNIGIEINKEE